MTSDLVIRKIEHFRKASLMGLNKVTQRSIMTTLKQQAREFIMAGNIEQSKFALRTMLEIKGIYAKKEDLESAVNYHLCLEIKFLIIDLMMLRESECSREFCTNWINYYRQRINLESVHDIEYSLLGFLLTYQEQLKSAKSFYHFLNYRNNQDKFKILGYTSPESLYQSNYSNKPDFLIIGVGKGGTTSLYQYMTKHPRILSAVDKELLFFGTPLFERYGIDWYRWQFPCIPNDSQLMTGEATPWYYYYGTVRDYASDMERDIRRLFPNIKIILLLRNPILRTFSHYQMHTNRGCEPRTFSESILSEIEFLKRIPETSIEFIKKNKFINKNILGYEDMYVLGSLYFLFIKRWLDTFPTENILILKSEDLFENPEATMNQIFHFLGLPSHSLTEYKNYLPGWYDQSIDIDTYQKLADFFRHYNQQLEELLGRQFNWD